VQGRAHLAGNRSLGPPVHPEAPRRRSTGAEAPRPRLLPRRRLLPRLCLHAAVPQLPQFPRRSGPRRRGLGRLPPRAGAPGPHRPRRLVDGPPLGGRPRGPRGARGGGVAGGARRLRARVPRGRGGRGQHSPPHGHASGDRRAAVRREDPRRRADPPLLPGIGQGGVGGDSPGEDGEPGDAVEDDVPVVVGVGRPNDQPGGRGGAEPGGLGLRPGAGVRRRGGRAEGPGTGVLSQAEGEWMGRGGDAVRGGRESAHFPSLRDGL
ncbi:hypothetical protein MUK42_12653, partial [Musa troglodytarum]